MSDPDNGDTTLLWSSSHSTLEQHSTPDAVNPHTPNVPSLANRQVQNYRSLNRSFTRPYSAKTVFFYKEGDIYFAGLRVPVSKARYRTIESLLDDLNSNISMPFGVRHLTTPRGKTIIKSIDQLQHHGRYIASSFKTPRPLNLSMVEKIQRIRQTNRTHAPHCYRNNLFNYGKQNKIEHSKIPLKLSLIPVTSKQILFVLNGKPSQIYRTLLNPFRRRTIESLLEEVSEGLQMAIFKLYTYSGKRIITMDEIFSLNEARLLAVPRNERPIFRENIFSMAPPLPPISRMTSPSILGQSTTTMQLIQSVYRENSIERPQRVVSNNKMMSLTSMSCLNRRESNEPKISLEISQHLPVLPLPERPPETCVKATTLRDAENCCNEVNEHIRNDIREESCRNKLTEPDKEKEVEDSKGKERSKEENKISKTRSEKEGTEEEELAQNNEEIEEYEATKERMTNAVDIGWFDSSVKEVQELMFSTSNDQAFDNNDTAIITSAPETDLSLSAKEDAMTYTVSVITGNRWAADTNLDLFIVLYGDLNKSKKHLLQQDTNELKFRQNRMDSFHIETAKLGLLQKIIIGHEHIGYGAGVYIERILVTENIADGRQYLFQCAKWLDSGQVDGKIERTLKLAAFCYLTTILYDSRSTSGRWELILHSGKDDGSGATTSNLNIVGYGSQGSSITTKIYDNRMAKVDFGEIGDLLKVRIEIDGNGEMPNYYLNYVELKDLDTEEHTVSYVRKWLKIVFSYEGKIKLSLRKQRFLEKSIAYMRIFGEIGETGHFPVDFKYVSDLKQELSFKAEAVSVGRIQCMRLYVSMNDIGKEIYEGIQMLQDIYDRQRVTNVAMASDWIAEKVIVRESHHAPYRYVMAITRVKTTEENEKDEEDRYDNIGDVFIELLLSEMEGLPTKISKKKFCQKETSVDSIDDNWRRQYSNPKNETFDTENGDELRFPAVNTILTSESVYEFLLSDVVYIITINSGESSANFDVYLTLSGTRGDTGIRKLINDDDGPFEEKKISTFEVEAVSIGEPLSIAITNLRKIADLKTACKMVIEQWHQNKQIKQGNVFPQKFSKEVFVTTKVSLFPIGGIMLGTARGVSLGLGKINLAALDSSFQNRDSYLKAKRKREKFHAKSSKDVFILR
ncbi:hypothetical protein DINM_004333 [Dirofilaria immitis]|nr:hypothetical protein [Dirofilaria immitis]